MGTGNYVKLLETEWHKAAFLMKRGFFISLGRITSTTLLHQREETMKRVVFALAIVTFVFGAASFAHASLLDGKEVHLDYLAPDKSTLLYNNTYTVTVDSTPGSLPEIADITKGDQIGASADFFDKSIDISIYAGQGSFYKCAFNGFHVYDDPLKVAPFTSVTIDPATNLPDFNSSMISFDANNIWVNFSGLGLNAPKTVALNLNNAPIAAPEPVSMLLLGVGGLAMAAFKRRKNSI